MENGAFLDEDYFEELLEEIREIRLSERRFYQKLKGAIVRKVKVVGYIPQKEVDQYPYVGMSEEEYYNFVSKATEMIVEAIEKYKENKKVKLVVK